jgi:hypothetical protein
MDTNTHIFPELENEAERILSINKIGNDAYDVLKSDVGNIKITETSDYSIHLRHNTIFEGKIMVIEGDKTNAVIFVGYCPNCEEISLWGKIKRFFKYEKA